MSVDLSVVISQTEAIYFWGFVDSLSSYSFLLILNFGHHDSSLADRKHPEAGTLLNSFPLLSKWLARMLVAAVAGGGSCCSSRCFLFSHERQSVSVTDLHSPPPEQEHRNTSVITPTSGPASLSPPNSTMIILIFLPNINIYLSSP